ncbi:hypothetical protein ONZ45_g4857 [Pleurotus djamor]|nr:hypothetical protein ONZ45_g4857 [Pleurotus djamor]
MNEASKTSIPFVGIAHKPSFPDYKQRDRPLSYQPRFVEVVNQPANNYGFPEPGIQSPTAKQVTGKDFMMSDETWEDICRHGTNDIDFIVIGSGFTALAFIQKTLQRDPHKHIICLERGDFWLPDHFQNLPLPFKYTLGGPSETFPFTLSAETLQVQIDKELSEKAPKIPTVTEAYPAPLAVSSVAQTSTIRFTKFSTPGPLLGIYKQQQRLVEQGKGSSLLFATDTAVQHLITDVGFPVPKPLVGQDKPVKIIRSSRPTDLRITSDKTKIILCAGAFPNTTLIQNSFPMIPGLETAPGRTVTGHFLTHLIGRVHRSAFKNLNPDSLEIAAEYVAGEDPDTSLQYHIQVTAIASPDPTQDAEDAARFCPDYAAAATEAQLKGSEDYVIFVCATLGELTEGNPDSFFKRNPNTNNGDPTANCVLQVLFDEKDKKLWDVMDKATFDTIEALAKGHVVEWWHEPKHTDDPSRVGWRTERPGNDTIRIPRAEAHHGWIPRPGNSTPQPKRGK